MKQYFKMYVEWLLRKTGGIKELILSFLMGIFLMSSMIGTTQKLHRLYKDKSTRK